MIAFIRKYVWIIAVLLLLPAFASGQTREYQSMRLERLDITDGLSQGMVFCMFQDSRGFMWFGTKEGLNRYDGHEFVVYKKVPGDSTSLPDNYVFGITEDTHGRLWLATVGAGVVLFEPKTERFTEVPLQNPRTGRALQTVDDVDIDGKGRVWVSAHMVRLFCLDATRKTVEEIRASVKYLGPFRQEETQEVNRLQRDASGRLLLLSDEGLFMLDEKQDRWQLLVDWARYFGYSVKVGRFNNAVVCDDGSIWVCSTEGPASHILHFSPDGKTLLRRMQLEIDGHPILVRDIAEGSDGAMYFLDFGYFIRYDRESDTYIAGAANRNAHGGYTGFGNHLFTDRSGILWVSTSGYGLNTFDPLTLAFESHTGDINFALFGKELRAFDREIRKRTSGAMRIVNDVFPLRTADGSVWCGTLDHGLWYYDAATGQTRQYGMRSGDPYSFLMIRHFRPFVDSRKQLWLGNKHGITKLNADTGEWTYFWFDGEEPDLTQADDYITAYFEAKDGSLWLGCKLRGLTHFIPETGSFRHFLYDAHDAASISHNHVLTIEPDPYQPERYLWIGTDGGGLCRFDMERESFERYGTESGLPNPVVYGILSDADGALWMSTNAGISRFDPRSGTFQNYDERDGLQGAEFNRQQYYRVGNRLAFGGVNGYNIFDPRRIHNNTTVPPVVITGFRLFNDRVHVRDRKALLETAMPYARTINLSHTQNMITLEFAALDFHAPDHNRYRYRLEGLTDGWIDAGTERVATFTNLDPGEYTFHVIGSNNHGVWNSTGASIRIVIEPPWYMTSWAFLLYAVLIIGALVSIDRLQKRRVIARERAESRVREARLRAEAAELEARAVRAENERKQKEMQVASVIQQRVLPQQLPKVPGYDIAAINLPAEEIGGDYYDCIVLPDGRVLLVIADVTGKGVPASLLVNSLHAALHMHLDHALNMSSLVQRLNTFLYESTPPNAFVTFQIAVLHPGSGEVEVVNAGHNPALHHLNGSVVETGHGRHLPLGCVAATKGYSSERYMLQPGEGMMLFTDGITEAMNAKQIPWGQEHLVTLLDGHRDHSAAMLLGLVVAELQQYAEGAEQSDDITAVYFRRRKIIP
ncbi:SpoIIE family protein phosphatase [bacterium]|nr:SpoIIE family protein phosphatase [bacterium]